MLGIQQLSHGKEGVSFASTAKTENESAVWQHLFCLLLLADSIPTPRARGGLEHKFKHPARGRMKMHLGKGGLACWLVTKPAAVQ